jgi:hypothetical protein
MYLDPHLHLGLRYCHFASNFSPKISCAVGAVCVLDSFMAGLVLRGLIILIIVDQYFLKRTNYEAPHRAVFSIFPLSSVAPCC